MKEQNIEKFKFKNKATGNIITLAFDLNNMSSKDLEFIKKHREWIIDNVNKNPEKYVSINYGTSGQTWDGGDLRGMFRANKESNNKLKWDSFLWRALNRVNIRWQENKSKYPVHNHLLPLSRTELEDAMFRHYLQLKSGDESEDHLSAIVLNAMMIMEAEINKTIINDGIKEWVKTNISE